MERPQLFGPVDRFSPLRRGRVRLFVNVSSLEGNNVSATLRWHDGGRPLLRDTAAELGCSPVRLRPSLITRQTRAVIYEVVSGVRAHVKTLWFQRVALIATCGKA